MLAKAVRRQSLTQQTVSGIFWQSGAAGANVVIRAIVLIILARHLPARDFGIVAAATVVATLTQVFSQIGVTKAIVQRFTLTQEHVRSGFAISIFTGVATAILLLLAAPLFATAFGIPEVEPVVRFFSLLLLLHGIAAVPMALLQRARRFRIISGIDLVAFALGFGCLGISLALAGFGVWALAIGQVSQVLIRTVSYFVATRPPIGLWPRWEPSKDLFRVGTGYSIGQIGNLVATQVDYFIVGRLLGAEILGLYSRAYQFLMLPAKLLGRTSQTVLFPSIASIQDQPERVARAFVRATGVIAMVTLPLSGVLILLAPELVTVTLGPRWEAMIVPFQILISTLLFRTSYKISDSVTMAMGSMYSRAWRQWIYAAAVAAGAFIGARWGLAGVAAGVGLAVALNFLAMTQLALKLTGVSAQQILSMHLRHALAAAPVLLSVALAVFYARPRTGSDLLVLAVGGAAAGFAFLVMWWRCRWIFGEDGAWAHSLAASRMPNRFRTMAGS